ncbi:MAG: hypothetical protein V8T29_01370, partial [Oscillospiraceae bacterium]
MSYRLWERKELGVFQLRRPHGEVVDTAAVVTAKYFENPCKGMEGLAGVGVSFIVFSFCDSAAFPLCLGVVARISLCPDSEAPP